MDVILQSLKTLAGTAGNVLPIVLFIFGFQAFVIRRRLQHLRRILAGLVLTVIGLALFLIGLEQTLFPLGRTMAAQLVTPTPDGEVNFLWVYAFAAAIGFSTAIAEPALLAVAMKANETSGGAISVLGLRVAVAIGVAVGVSLGCYRIIAGLPLHWFIIAAYVIVVLQTVRAPRLIVPLAYDSGGVTTSTVTVPLVAALGLGLAETIPGRNSLIDGFGLVAVAALFPIIAVLAYSQITRAITTRATATRASQSDSRSNSRTTEDD